MSVKGKIAKELAERVKGGDSLAMDYASRMQRAKDGGAVRIQNEFGRIDATPDGDVLRVGTVRVNPESRGKGHGKQLYKDLIEEANRRGYKRVVSDETVEEPAARIYQSLKRDGLNVSENPNIKRVDVTKPEKGVTIGNDSVYYHAGDEPPFSIDLPSKKSSANLLASKGAGFVPVGGALAVGAGLTPEEAEAGVIIKGGKKMIDAWHGSPHDFDKFQMSQIGTGEGAQAYGHGLYFADDRGISEGYREGLSRQDHLKHGGKKYEVIKDDDGVYEVLENTYTMAGGFGDGYESGATTIGKKFKTPQEAEAWVRKERGLGGNYELVPSEDGIEYGGEIVNKGSLYNVNIDATPDELLDWDLPLSEQSEVVKDRVSDLYVDFSVSDDTDFNSYLKKEFPTFYDDWGTLSASQQSSAMDAYKYDTGRNPPMVRAGVGVRDKPTMERFYKRLSDDPAKASELLKDRGIKGIQYDDAMSRGAEGGTKNYVIFDENIISIANKYGIPVSTASLVAAGTISPQEAMASHRQAAPTSGISSLISQPSNVRINDTISPNEPITGGIANLIDRADRATMGSPANLLVPMGIADFMRNVSTGKENTALDYGFAIADVLP